MIGQNGNTYEDTFYIIPRYIRKIPGITLAYLDIYEAMFQYWNKGLEVFMGEKGFLEKTGYGRTVYYDALKFFEDCGEIKRVWIKGKRYIQRVLKLEPNDSSKTEQDSAIADPDVRTCGQCTSTFADHNKKKLKKEKNISESDDSPHVIQDDKSISNIEMIDAFIQIFPNHPHPDIKKPDAALVINLNKLRKSWAKEISSSGKSLTLEIFMNYLKNMIDVKHYMTDPNKNYEMVSFITLKTVKSVKAMVEAKQRRSNYDC